ncbi:MAG: heavy-metal-associated domain-containing protein [Patescibacteria group bacterium]|nr:heavy-metal-associated domain-containing protein [Patescibacteria group bacterium]
MKQIIQFSGLTCEACQRVIQKRLGRIDGVKEVKVELNGQTEIETANLISKNEVEKALEGTNYKIVKI